MSVLREVLDAFRVELGVRRRSSVAGTRRGGKAPLCPCCRLFVRGMCQSPYDPCGVCVDCCPGGHKPPAQEKAEVDQ